MRQTVSGIIWLCSYFPELETKFDVCSMLHDWGWGGHLNMGLLRWTDKARTFSSLILCSHNKNRNQLWFMHQNTLAWQHQSQNFTDWHCITNRNFSHTAVFSGIARSITKNNMGASNILFQTRSNELVHSNSSNYDNCSFVLCQNTLFLSQTDGCSLTVGLTEHKLVNDWIQRG
jgi:hypothetical protein